MSGINELLRNIPQIEKLMQDSDIAGLIEETGKVVAANIVRACVEKHREAVITGSVLEISNLKNDIIFNIKLKISEKLQRIINGTGIIIHTNFGRAPLGENIFNRLKEQLSGFCNLEFHIPTKSRGKRGGFAEELICHITGAEDALIVNNNASGVFLILREFAQGKEVIVSRGELIQIGGGFRIPDIMKESGAVLVETGTTNITAIEDYMSAITKDTAMIFSAHTSNYKIEGFSESPSLRELSKLKNENIIYVRDLGSGNVVQPENELGVFEQTVYSEIAQGPDIICFSGDKLLGGCQAGIIAGNKAFISRLRKNQLMRMIRVDKITYMILQETLIEYINGNKNNVELWKLIMQKPDDIMKKVNSFFNIMKDRGISGCSMITETKAAYGGGSMPGIELDSYGVEISIPETKPNELNDYFLSFTPPIAGIVRDNRYIIDFFTIFERDVNVIINAVESLVNKSAGNI
ncbi:MAG: L-seryl-tRNA(Sec) selenium transferase [Spirochaetes bacterium]|nr:L-seryl-tRNA(Sec) selenium transferase [Spirochaetota bacterium]